MHESCRIKVCAQFNLGLMYAKGQGVIPRQKIYVWWAIAVSGGDKSAIKYRDIVVEKLSPQAVRRGIRRSQ